VRFDLDHRFGAPVAAVEDAMVDPVYLEALRLPDVAPPTVLGVETEDSLVTTRVAYQYTGSLDAIAQRVLRGSDIGWVQEVTLDRTTHRARFSVVPKVHADRLRCSGTYTLSERDGTTTRVISGDLRINVPLVASRAEKMIVPGLVRRMRLEAAFLDEWLQQSG
jgi:Protein of unknown function (DUF2505)